MTIALALFAALHITLAAPQPLVEFDAGTLKGELARLAWSADGSELYVQTVERDRAGAIKGHHHAIIAVATQSVKETASEPAWAAQYWQWKSAQASPADQTFRITVDERTETKRAVSAPTGGDLARGGTPSPTAGTTLGDVANAANAAQTLHIFALTVKTETLGEWVNAPVTPGTNFSWAPAPLRLLAFTKRNGGPLVVLDSIGTKQELPGPREALMPAWSSDGKRLAWLERHGKKYQVMTADISAQ